MHELVLNKAPANPQRRLRQYILLLLGLLLIAALALMAASALLVPAPRGPDLSHVEMDVPPGSPPVSASAGPDMITALAPDEAQRINAAIPIAAIPNPSARAFHARFDDLDALRSAECLTAAIYYEAGNETDDGERAVAQVVLNRVRHPAFPHTVCGVVFEGAGRATGCQFTFTCDGSLARPVSPLSWARARRFALAALAGAVYAPVGWATHYHANYVVPKWAGEMSKIAVIGAHIFYRWPNGWGSAAAFREPYSGNEQTDIWSQKLIDQGMDPAGNALPDPSLASPAIPATDLPRLAIRDLPPANAATTPTAPPPPAGTRWAIRGDQAPPAAPAPTSERPIPAASPDHG